MKNQTRGRPQGHTGQAPILKPDEIRRLIRVAKSRPRFAARAEAILSVSLYLGLRAKEIASLLWADRGTDWKAIAVLAGHSNIRTTALYVDASPLKLSRILADVSW